MGSSVLHSRLRSSTILLTERALQGYPGVQVGTNVHASDLAYTKGIVNLNNRYSEIQGLFEEVNRNAATVGMRIKASKTKAISALIPSEQRQTALLDGELLEDVEKFCVYRKRPGQGRDEKPSHKYK